MRNGPEILPRNSLVNATNMNIVYYENSMKIHGCVRLYNRLKTTIQLQGRGDFNINIPTKIFVTGFVSQQNTYSDHFQSESLGFLRLVVFIIFICNFTQHFPSSSTPCPPPGCFPFTQLLVAVGATVQQTLANPLTGFLLISMLKSPFLN